MKHKTLLISSEEPDTERLDASRLTEVSSDNVPVRRAWGNLVGKSYYLSTDYDWILGRDSENELVLVPLKKKA